MDAIVMDDFYYTKEHEWISVENGIGTVGISDYAQASLGDITFIELPEADSDVEQFEELASIESVKAASDIYAPVSGKITEVNSELEEDPSFINQKCYSLGWLAKIQISDEEELTNLMTAEEYRQYLQSIE